MIVYKSSPHVQTERPSFRTQYQAMKPRFKTCGKYEQQVNI